MRLVSFKAKNVHEFLNFDVMFRDDLNFIAGLNGCGKTTALKLIMALLTPNLKELKEVRFDSVELVLYHKNVKYIISSFKKKDSFKLEVIKDGKKETHTSFDPHSSETSNWELAKRKMLIEEAEIDAALTEIKSLPVPMFLSLERSRSENRSKDDFFFDDVFVDNKKNNRRVDRSYNNLGEAIEIISRSIAIARSKQSRLDKDLRDKIIKNALAFNPQVSKMTLPDTRTLYEIKRKQEAIKLTLDNLGISSEEFSEYYREFFEKVSFIAEEVDSQGAEDMSEFDFDENPEVRESMYEWFINQGQLKRVETIFGFVENYQNRKVKVYSSLDKFQTLVNNFLKETGKEITFDSLDGPKIKIMGKTRSISVLSSGESQIVCMLAHLVLNKTLQKDGVFIVDEPELSLHLSWQDKFVEAVQEANPELQVILATHSPAIFGGRNEMFVALNKEVRD